MINTFNEVFKFFDKEQFDFEVDYTAPAICLFKIFEIEINLSVVHWIRNYLNIEMPTYFKKHKEDSQQYTLLPSSSLVQEPEVIDFNSENRLKWIPPGIGQSELAARTLLEDNLHPSEISEYRSLLEKWKVIRRYRNKSTHNECMKKDDFFDLVKVFAELNYSKKIKELNDLKEKYKPA